MTLILELPPALESKLRKRARTEGRAEAEVALKAVESYLRSTDDKVETTFGARILAELEAEGALGLWQDRPEDSVALARELRKQAETRG